MTETTQHKSNTPIEWGQAEGFSKYLISTDGQVYSLKRDRLLPQGFTERGYKLVILARNGVYTDMMKKIGAICIDFDFEMKNRI